MITQYDAVAEIEAMKWRRTRAPRTTAGAASTRVAEEVSPSWEGANEAAIRREMERRLAQRAATKRD